MKNPQIILCLFMLTCLIACEQKAVSIQNTQELDSNTVDEVMTDASVSLDASTSAADSSVDAEPTVTEMGPIYPEAVLGLSEYSLEHNGLTREYLLYVPQSYSVDTATPVILNFHGNGGLARYHLQLADMRELADQENVILIYPQGSLLDGEESHWNPLLASETNKSDVDDFGFVSLILDEVSRRLNVDATRVYATGYSNGAGLAYGLVCYLSDRITAAAPVSGSMYIEMSDNCNASHPTAIAIFNGTEDFIRPYAGYTDYLLPVDDTVEFWRTYNQIEGSPTIDRFDTNGLTVERSVYSGGNGDVSVDLYKVIGGDHVWFDINLNGEDLNQTIWRFFSRFDSNGLR